MRDKCLNLSEIPDFDLLDIACRNDVDFDGIRDREGLENAVRNMIDARVGAASRKRWERWGETASFEQLQDLAIKGLAPLQGPQSDMMTAHAVADQMLCRLLVLLGFGRVVQAWQRVDKFYG
jgi:hypothetical protein